MPRGGGLICSINSLDVWVHSCRCGSVMLTAVQKVGTKNPKDAFKCIQKIQEPVYSLLTWKEGCSVVILN